MRPGFLQYLSFSHLYPSQYPGVKFQLWRALWGRESRRTQLEHGWCFRRQKDHASKGKSLEDQKSVSTVEFENYSIRSDEATVKESSHALTRNVQRPEEKFRRIGLEGQSRKGTDWQYGVPSQYLERAPFPSWDVTANKPRSWNGPWPCMESLTKR
jgi:hypothetical protein